ncbi:hypothetical protein BGZ74_009400 [Mortierella antarctica]|nr:hypothetical protein BGZ74_009400 [Mortierella antarctica]
MTQTIQVIVHRVESLDDVEHMGKNDPYVQLTTDLTDKEGYKKTTVKKNAGRNAEFEEHLTLDSYDQQSDNYLFVEVLESDVGIDPPIGFTAIPLLQVKEAPHHALKGEFQLYTPKGKEKGSVTLSIFIVPSGQPAPHVQLTMINGRTEIVSDQKKRIETLKTNEKINDVGAAAAIFGGLYALKKVHDASKKPKNIEA